MIPCEYNSAVMPAIRLQMIDVFLFLACFLTACGGQVTSLPASQPATEIVSNTPTVTPVPPSPTPEPLAAKVNGEEILQSDFEAEWQRYQSAQTGETTISEEEAKQIVLDDMINQILLAQAAREARYTLDDQSLNDRLNQLIEESGGSAAFETWLMDNGYTEETFRKALKLSVEAAWMRDQVISQVPSQGEQIRARQILLYDADQAADAYAQLESGADFSDLASLYDPVTKGDLGWLARGTLLDPNLEEAAFNLQPGEYTPVIETSAGFHILQVVEKVSARDLTPEARLLWQQEALKQWIADKLSQSEIVTFIP